MSSNTKAFPPNFVKMSDYFRADVSVVVPNDVTLEAIMTPGKWANNWKEMPVRARVEITREDLTLDGTFRVILSQPGIVKLRAMGHVHNDESNIRKATNASIPEDGRDPPEGYLVKHTPALQGYYVKLKDNGEMITAAGQKGLTKGQATSIAWNHYEMASTPLQTA
jgi:hypothetical protein